MHLHNHKMLISHGTTLYELVTLKKQIGKIEEDNWKIIYLFTDSEWMKIVENG